jgi:hypothetical protein
MKPRQGSVGRGASGEIHVAIRCLDDECHVNTTAVMTDLAQLPFDLLAVERKKLTVDFADGSQSTDSSLLSLRQAENRLGVCFRLAASMPDRRDPARITTRQANR